MRDREYLCTGGIMRQKRGRTEGRFGGYRAGPERNMQDLVCELPRIPIPRTPVNSACPRFRRAWQRRGCNASGGYLSGGTNGRWVRGNPYGGGSGICHVLASPRGAGLLNEHKVAGLVSPTDVVGNIKSGKRASQKRGDLRSHERCKSNSELVEGEGPFCRARPHRG